jgi:phage terminase large subunit-like protein
VCFEQYEYGKAIENGELKDARFFFHWVEAPEDADYRDPEVWKAANPSYGVTVQEEFFEDQLQKKPENVFRRYFLNQWTASEEAWLPHGAWEDCFEEGASIPEREKVILGVDIGTKKDTSAVVRLWKRDDGKIVVEAEVFAPRGEVAVNISEVETAILKNAERYDVREVAYDRTAFIRSAEDLREKGLFMVEIPQSVERMTQNSMSLFEAVMQKQLVHNGDPILAAHVRAGATKQHERGWRLVKDKATKPIDALIAMALGFSRIEVKEQQMPFIEVI